MNFSMNPDPASWLELAGGTIAHDQYPDGSFAFRITSYDASRTEQAITLKSTLPAAIIAAAQAVEALRWLIGSSNHITLVVQTFPDQRGDKRVKDGETIAAKVTAAIFGTIDADTIIVHDLHSMETLDCLELYCAAGGAKVVHVEPLTCFKLAMHQSGMVGTIIDDTDVVPYYVVAVDKGAIARATQVANSFGAKLIEADKKRDADGKIIGHRIVEGPKSIEPDATIWVIDDLVDGGWTFTSIAALLRERYNFGKLRLYVTHGLFSKGRGELNAHYDSVTALFSYDD